MSARDVIATSLSGKSSFIKPDEDADDVIRALTAAGYRIVGPGETWGPLVGSHWRHKKRRHVYEVVGQCRIEATNEPAFLYRDVEVGTVWARPIDEFLDGRFERLSLAKGGGDG